MSRNIKIVALCGYKQSGKSSVGRYLCSYYAYKILRFADRLKEMIRVLGVADDYIDGDLKEVPCAELCGKTVRHAMQTLGTEWGRRLIDNDLWVNQLKMQMDYHISCEHKRFVIDDLRFLNEEKWLKSLVFAPYNYDVKIIRIKRYGNNVISNHQSELEMDQIVEDWTVFNDGTKEEMFKSLDDILGGK